MDAGGAGGSTLTARSADPVPTTVTVRVLGPVRLVAPDGGAVEAAGTLGKRLVVALALAGETGRSTAGLIEDVWADEPPRNPRAALQMLVSRIRAVAAPDAVRSTAVGYALPRSDLAIAEHAADALASGGPPDAVRIIEALGLLDGEPAADLEPSELSDDLRARADRARNLLTRARVTALLDAGDAEQAAAVLDRLDPATIDPALQLLRMRTLAAAGRTSDAIESFAAYRERLAGRLGADPDAELTALNAELLRTGDAAASVRTVGLRAAPNALLGRDDDLRNLLIAVPDGRLTTIGGAGGLGKTRLAHAVGAALTDRFERVVFVELAGARAADDVPLVLGDAVGARTVRAGRRLTDAPVTDLPTRIREALGARRTLLILDNCEQVVDAVAALTADLLAAVPSLTVLTTSRVPLLVAGERMVPLAPLDPATHAADLFRERAAAARPDAALDPDLVRQVCARLDGLPLAIELAAARLRSMTLVELDRRLGDRFDLLVGGDRTAPERHRTLFAVIDWSWQLLTARARTALALLAVFPDGFTTDSAGALLGEDPAAVLAELVEQSLLTLREDGPTARFRMLETVREFGLRALAESGQEQRAAAALDAWGAAFAVAAAPTLNTAVGTARGAVVAAEEETLLTLLRADPAGRGGVILPMFALLGEWWIYRGDIASLLATAPIGVAAARTPATTPQGREAELRALTIASAVLRLSGEPSGTRATALLRRAVRHLDPDADGFWPTYARLLLRFRTPLGAEQLLTAPAASPDPAIASFALIVRSLLLENAGRSEDALLDAARAGALADRHGLTWVAVTARTNTAQLHSQRGDRQLALSTGAVARAQLLQMDRRADVRQLDWTLAANEAAVGDLASAERRFRLLTELPGDVGGDEGEMRAVSLAGLAEVAEARGDAGAADRWWGQALATPMPLGMPWRVVVQGAALAAVAARPGDGPQPALTTQYRRLRTVLLALPRALGPIADAPVYGTGVLGVAAVLLRCDAEQRPAGVELAALAASLGGRRDLPSLGAVPALASEVTNELMSELPAGGIAGAASATPPITGGAAVARVVQLLSRPTLSSPVGFRPGS